MTTLALDAMGVIYAAADDVAELLCPFIRERGGLAEDDCVEAYYRDASLGLISAVEFWRRVHIEPDVEDEYLGGHQLSEGLIDFLLSPKPSVSAVWCVSNDISQWSRKLRERFGLSPHFAGWVISGDVGTRKPDPEIFHHLITQAETPAEDICFVDDRLANLDAASALGFQTIWFNPGDASTQERHRVAANFQQLYTLICSSKTA